MPYINIFIPRKYRIPMNATGVYYYDTIEEYSETGFFDNSFELNKNVLGYANKFFTGKVIGRVFNNHYYIYDNFEQYTDGFQTSLTGDFKSGYNNKKQLGNLSKNHYYIYDDYEQYTDGFQTSLTGDFKSGYNNKKQLGNLSKNHYYIYDDYEQYSVGTINDLSATYVSGYFNLYNFIQAVHNISGVY